MIDRKCYLPLFGRRWKSKGKKPKCTWILWILFSCA